VGKDEAMKRKLGAYIQENRFIGERVQERAVCVLESLMKSGWELNNVRVTLIDGQPAEVVFNVTCRQEHRN
jgi:hypothetical protein